MTTELQLANLEREAKVAKDRIELGAALERLRSHRDFNKLVVEGYLKDEALRLVYAKGNPALQSDASQAAIVRDIDAIASLNAFFTTVAQQAAMAGRDLAGIEDTREEILAGDD